MADERLCFRRVISNPTQIKKVVSYGLIVRSHQGRVLLVRRRYTPAFLNLMRGTYRVSRLNELVANLSQEEANGVQRLLDGKEEFTVYFASIFSPWFDRYLEMLATAEIRYRSAAPYLRFYFSGLELKSLRANPEWLFPKGRQKFREDADTCARRECKEETGIDVGQEELVFSGSVTVLAGGKIYETQHFTCTIDEVALGDCTEMEIGAKKWASLEECSSLLSADRYRLLGA